MHVAPRWELDFNRGSPAITDTTSRASLIPSPLRTTLALAPAPSTVLALPPTHVSRPLPAPPPPPYLQAHPCQCLTHMENSIVHALLSVPAQPGQGPRVVGPHVPKYSQKGAPVGPILEGPEAEPAAPALSTATAVNWGRGRSRSAGGPRMSPPPPPIFSWEREEAVGLSEPDPRPFCPSHPRTPTPPICIPVSQTSGGAARPA